MNALALLLLLATPDVPRDAPGTWADPARGVFLVPGSRTLLSGFSPVSFDGLTFDATSYWFDGVRLRLPAHALFGPTVLQAAWLEGVHVGPAVDSVERGRTLGRAVELLPRARQAGFHGAARLDVLQTALFVENELGPGATHVQAAGRFFTVPAVAASFLGIRALLGDWQLRAAQPVGQGEVRFLLLGAVDSAALSVSGIPIEARLASHQADLRWKSDATGSTEVALSGGWDTLGLSLNGTQTRNDVEGAEQSVGARAVVRRDISSTAGASLGGDVSVRRLSLARTVSTRIPSVDGSAVGSATESVPRELGVAVLAGLFSELHVDEGPWRWTAGARLDVWKPADAPAFFTADPRVTAQWDAGGRFAFVAALGVAHQGASWLVPAPVLDTAALRFGAQEAAKAEATVLYRPAAGQAVSLRGFGTALFRTLELSPFDADFLQEVNLVNDEVAGKVGHGWAAGGELCWRLFDDGGFWAQVAYSFQASWRELEVTHLGRDGLPVGSEQAWVPWQYQQAHALTAAAGWRGGRGWAVSLALSVQSGPPLAGGLFAQDSRAGLEPTSGATKWIPKDRDAVGFASPWLRLDARVSKTWHPGNLEVELYLDVQTLSVWAQPTGTAYGVAPATLEEQARGDLRLTSKPASSVIPGPLPVLGVEARL